MQPSVTVLSNLKNALRVFKIVLAVQKMCVCGGEGDLDEFN